jgi:hypothetical protein
MPFHIQETYVNRTENHIYGESAIEETNTDNLGVLFRALQKEWGRCESKVYVDTPEGTKHIGWTFARMSRYEGGRLKGKDAWYCREVWVTVFDMPE